MFESLENLLDKDHCRLIASSEGTDKVRTINLIHEYGEPLDAHNLNRLSIQYGRIAGLVDLYKRYSYLDLYVDEVSEDTAFLIAHPNDWDSLGGRFREWLDISKSTDDDFQLAEWLHDAPDWLSHDYIVFGEIPSDSRYFIIPLYGEDHGSVIEFDHDGAEFTKVSTGLSDFIDYLCTIDNDLVYEIANQMRFIAADQSTDWTHIKYTDQ